MKYFKKATFLLALGGLIMAANPSKATHIAGMEMYYECMDASTNLYKISLKAYRWCSGVAAPFSDSIYIAIYDTSGNLVNGPLGLVMHAPDSNNIFTLTNETHNPCLMSPPGICVEEAVYEGLCFFPSFEPGGYHITFQQCCRGGSVSNLIGASNSGTSLFVSIPPDNIASCNSSVEYDLHPPTITCLGDTFVYDHSGTDPDGDSIVYALCSATDGNFISTSGAFDAYIAPSKYINTFFDVAYSSGTGYSYSATDPVYAPNLPFTIDPQSGVMAGLPELAGEYVVAVCAYEYRNGELLSVNKRDFTFNVATCIESIAADFSTVTCANLAVNFVNTSLYGSSYYWDFGVTNQTTDTSTLHSPTYTYANAGTYDVTLIVNKGMWCADTMVQSITVTTSSTPNAYFYPFVDSLQTHTIYLIENSTGTNLSYYWDFGDSSYSNDQYPVHVYSDFGTYDVCLTVADTQSCTSTYCLTLDLDSVPKTSMGFTLIVVPEEPTSVIYNTWMDNTHVAIYPNPTSGQLTISGDKGTTEVYDMYGRKVLKTNSSQIDLSNEPQGIYFIQLTTEEGSRFVKKVVKHK